MKLYYPIEIAPNLCPGVRLGSHWLTVDYDGITEDRRTRYRWECIGNGGPWVGNDLCSGVGGGDLQAGLVNLLSFLSAAIESNAYRRRTGYGGENADLFPADMLDALEDLSDEISTLALDLEESETPYIEE